jgi:hypothetical protein
VLSVQPTPDEPATVDTAPDDKLTALIAELDPFRSITYKTPPLTTSPDGPDKPLAHVDTVPGVKDDDAAARPPPAAATPANRDNTTPTAATTPPSLRNGR